MKKKIVFIVLLLVVIIGIAFVGQWYSAAIEVLDLETQTFDLGKGVTLEMVRIPAGTFRMGSNDALSFLPWRELQYDGNETPAHAVELSEFWIGKYEVTQEQYKVIRGGNPSNFKGAKNPSNEVMWDDAMKFCKTLSNSTGKWFTLPTEAQWEYACRAGSTTTYYFGNDESILGDYAWYDKNSGRRTHPVGQKMPNHWGLYDMHGNVREWCRDYCDENFYGTSAAIMKNPENTKRVYNRVLRGGSLDVSVGDCRSACRDHYYPDRGRYYDAGFRIVLTQP